MLGGANSRCFVAGGFLMTLDDGKSSEKFTPTQAGLLI